MYEYLWHEEKECLNLPRRCALLYIATFSMKVTDIADFHGKICDLLTPWKRYEVTSKFGNVTKCTNTAHVAMYTQNRA